MYTLSLCTSARVLIICIKTVICHVQYDYIILIFKSATFNIISINVKCLYNVKKENK